MVVYRHALPGSVPTATSLIATLTAIGQAAGLSAATGLRPFLPPLVAGVFARSDFALDYDGTAFAFLESTWFLAAVFAATIVWYLLERRDPGGSHQRALGVLAAILGGVLFAGTLAAAGLPAWAGAVAGAACAALGTVAVSGVLARTRERLQPTEGALLGLWVDLATVALAALAVIAWPVGLVALVPLAWLAIAGRRAAERKHAGLRTLR